MQSAPDTPAPATRKYAKHSRTARRFVEEYLVDHCGSRAIVRAGFKGRDPYTAASRLLKTPKVQQLLAEREAELLQEIGVRQERVLRELAAIAFHDARTLFRDDGTLKPPAEWDDATAAAIAAIDVEELFEGRGEAREHVGTLRKVKRAEKLRALELLGQYLRMFRQVTELTGAEGGPIQVQATSSEDEL